MTGERQYLEIMKRLINDGDFREGRNGGVYSLFGEQMKFDLRDGFPLLTTKKVHFKSIVVELLWFLRGDTNVKYLHDHGVTIWDEWADEAGELGPVYPHQWRKWGSKPDGIPQPKPNLRSDLKATYLGVGNGTGKEHHMLGKTWEGMISRCYDPKNPTYPIYGGRGVSVCDRWLEFKAFAEDAEKLPGWWNKQNIKSPRYVIDKDIRGSGFLYSPENCMWVTDKENLDGSAEYVYTVRKNGVDYQFTNVRDFCSDHGANANNFSDLWTGRKNAHMRNGFTFVSREKINPGIDQIANVIESLRSDPYGRRHIVSAWNPGEVDAMALPPCHCLFQFHVSQGRLNCKLYQRSADWFLGVPFNIASYALLTHIIAREVGLEPGVFVHTFGDLHLYANHIEQAKTQLERTPKKLPVLRFPYAGLDKLQPSDFQLDGYLPHPTIKAPVSA